MYVPPLDGVDFALRGLVEQLSSTPGLMVYTTQPEIAPTASDDGGWKIAFDVDPIAGGLGSLDLVLRVLQPLGVRCGVRRDTAHTWSEVWPLVFVLRGGVSADQAAALIVEAREQEREE